MRCLLFAMMTLGIATGAAVQGDVVQGKNETSASVPIPEEARTAAQWTLHIEGLRLPPGGGIVQVYASRGDSAPEAAKDQANYVGYIAPVPRNSRESAQGVVVKGTLLDLTAKLGALKSDKEVRITLVRTGPAPSTGPQDQKLTWDRVYITFR